MILPTTREWSCSCQLSKISDTTADLRDVQLDYPTAWPTQAQTSSDKLERDLSGDAHALVEMGDFEARDERGDLIGRGFLHFYAVCRASGTKYKFVGHGRAAIGRVSPKVVEECLIAHLETSEACFIDGAGVEGPRMLEDRGQ